MALSPVAKSLYGYANSYTPTPAKKKPVAVKGVGTPRRVAPVVPKFGTPRTLVGDLGVSLPGASPSTAPTYAPGPESAPGDPNAAMSAALAARSRGLAQSEAAAKKAQAAIEYGEGPAGVANPFSIQKVNERNYTRGVSTLEDQLNKAGLFYSGYRGKQLGEAATNYQQTGYDAATRYRAFLSDVDSQLAAALMQADMLDGGGGGGGGGGPVAQTARPGEYGSTGIPIVQAFDPYRNSDAKYDVNWILANGGQKAGGDIIDANGIRYDSDGRRR